MDLAARVVGLQGEGAARQLSGARHPLRFDEFEEHLSVHEHGDGLALHHDLLGEPLVVGRRRDKVLYDVVDAAGPDRIFLRVVDLHLVALCRPALRLECRVEEDARVGIGLRQHVGLEVEILELGWLRGIGTHVEEMAPRALADDLSVDHFPTGRVLIHLPACQTLAIEQRLESWLLGDGRGCPAGQQGHEHPHRPPTVSTANQAPAPCVCHEQTPSFQDCEGRRDSHARRTSFGSYARCGQDAKRQAGNAVTPSASRGAERTRSGRAQPPADSALGRHRRGVGRPPRSGVAGRDAGPSLGGSRTPGGPRHRWSGRRTPPAKRALGGHRSGADQRRHGGRHIAGPRRGRLG